MASDRDRNPTRATSRPTISEVAAEAGVGRASAARTLGGYGYVSPELRERVLTAAEKLGYRTNALARSMSTGVSHTLGVIVADIGNPFFAGVVRGISDASRARGFDTIVLSTHEEVAEERAALDVLLDKRVDGVIMASAALVRADVDHIRTAVDHGMPIVLVDRVVDSLDLDAVVIDNRDAARRAAALLIAAGHRRIGFIWGPSTVSSITTRRELTKASARNLYTDGERLHGYLDALDDAGIPFEADLVMTGPKYEATATETVTRMLSASNPPTALLCSETDAMTGALRAIRDLGLRYPADVSLVGFDDSSWAAVMDPPITMIEQPMQRLGACAADLLINRLQQAASGAEARDAGADVSSIHTLTTRLIERASVSVPPQL